MSYSVRQSKVKLVNPITKLPTEQLTTHNLRERQDLIKDKSFLRCSIQDWDRFTKLCDEQLGVNVLYFVAMLIAEVLEEVGTSDGFLCQSDNDDFTIIDLAVVIPKISKRLQQRFTPEALAQEPVYISRIRSQVDGDKIPTSLKLITKIITADEFFQIERHPGKEAS
jgi:hypothetical protein